jgi:hypothetical protein
MHAADEGVLRARMKVGIAHTRAEAPAAKIKPIKSFLSMSD